MFVISTTSSGKFLLRNRRLRIFHTSKEYTFPSYFISSRTSVTTWLTALWSGWGSSRLCVNIFIGLYFLMISIIFCLIFGFFFSSRKFPSLSPKYWITFPPSTLSAFLDSFIRISAATLVFNQGCVSSPNEKIIVTILIPSSAYLAKVPPIPSIWSSLWAQKTTTDFAMLVQEFFCLIRFSVQNLYK